MKKEPGILSTVMMLAIVALWLVGCGKPSTPSQTDGTVLQAGAVTSNPNVTPTKPGSALALELEPAEPIDLPTPTRSGSVDLVTPNARPSPTPPLPTVHATEIPAPAATAAPLEHYIIQPGDTLLGLAVEHGISMAAIQLANNMGTSIDLIAGQTLKIPADTQWLEENRFWVVHVVQPGETLDGVSQAFQLTVDDILRVNAIADPDMIHVDQQLVMPIARLVTLVARQPTATAPVAAGLAAAASTESSPAPEVAGTSPEAAPVVETPLSEPPPTAAPPPGLPSGPGDWPVYILARINQVRAEHGLNTLTAAPELTYAAQAHAEDCARRGWGSHVGSDGAVLRTRLVRAGYAGRNSGENWVQAQGAVRAFDWWYGEIPPNDPHRRNILSPYYTEIGIGIAEFRSGYIFVTDFGRR